MSKFIGQFIPAHLLVKYDMSQAQSMFCLKLLKSKHFSSVISLIQTNILPNILSELDFNEVKYIQYRKFPQKGFLRLLNNILENISIVLYCRYEKNIFDNVINNNYIEYYGTEESSTDGRTRPARRVRAEVRPT